MQEQRLKELRCFGLALQFEPYYTNPRRWIAKPLAHVALELSLDGFGFWRAELWLSDGDGIYSKTGETRPFPRPCDALEEVERIWRPRAVALTQALEQERRTTERLHVGNTTNRVSRGGRPGNS